MTDEPTPEELEAARRDAMDMRRGSSSPVPDAHRMLPSNSDAEQGVLSSFLLAPREVGGMCAEKGARAEHFHVPAHALLFGVLMAMWDDNEPIDVITLTAELRNRDELSNVGGHGFVTQLFAYLPTAANAGYYLEIILEKFTLRKMIGVGTKFASQGYEAQENVPGLLDSFEKEVLSIRLSEKRQLKTMHQLAAEVIDDFNAVAERKGAIMGLSTGFPDLDKMTDGLHGSEMIVIAARPSMGKTALAMNIVEHMSINASLPIAVFSLEMSAKQLTHRLMCSMARINYFRYRDGFYDADDNARLRNAAERISKSKIIIDDDSDQSIQAMRAKARRFHAEKGIVAVFMDYLQLARSSTKRAQENRQQEVAEVSAGCKGMAKELGIPVVVLAQLTRGVENGKQVRRPRLSDLRDSGATEQDADLVGMLVRDELYAETEEEKRDLEGQATLMIAKQRHGPIGDVSLTFLKEFTRFESRSYGHADDDRQESLPL